MNKSKTIHLCLLLLSLIFSFILAETGYRIVLFTDIQVFDRFQKPQHFADYFSEDDYWKLYYLFDGRFKPPQQPHPQLGWIGDFSRDSYLHNQIEHIGDRRPVLLYGDSFASCMQGVLCFQDILNSDQLFSKRHYLFNYGVGGYGLDQIFLLLQKSIHQYDDPFVVMSLMTFDLDRSILSVRTGQKPYFSVEDDKLKLRGIPINSDPDHFFTTNPPQIKSYLYRRIIHSDLLPEQLSSFLRRENDSIGKKKQVSEKIILEIVKELRAKKIDFVLLILHPHWEGVSTLDDDTGWRDSFLKQVLRTNTIPYIWSKEIFTQDSREGNHSYEDYISPGNGHPTTHFNKLIAEEIKKHVLENQ